MIKIKNVEQTINRIKKEFNANANNSINNKAKVLVDALKEATPIDTGEARNGWKYQNKSILNEVEHIKYLNEGSSVQAPAYFIEKTILSQQGVFPSGTIVVSK